MARGFSYSFERSDKPRCDRLLGRPWVLWWPSPGGVPPSSRAPFPARQTVEGWVGRRARAVANPDTPSRRQRGRASGGLALFDRKGREAPERAANLDTLGWWRDGPRLSADPGGSSIAGREGGDLDTSRRLPGVRQPEPPPTTRPIRRRRPCFGWV